MQLRQNMLFDDRYLLIKLLGSGGFSEVWLVEDTKVSHKKMALKVYAPGKGLDDDGVQLFSNEFELVFDLNHANLLRPAHFDVYERSPYLLMPYCEQGSTHKLVGRFAEEDAWRFLHDVAAGLAYLHTQQPPIIHQDIKPDNVLKDMSGHYLITDFGISAKSRSTLLKSMHNAKLEGGTMAYMPPERFGKESIPIKASDIWAMGATLFELLSGYLPFGAHGGLMQKSGAEIPDLPGKWSKELQEIITRCLRKEPWNRPVAQQIVEWTEKRFAGKKIRFRTTKSSKIIGWGMASCFIGLLLAYIIANHFSYPPNKRKNNTVTQEKSIIYIDEKPEVSVVSETVSTDSLASMTAEIPLPDSELQAQPTSTVSPTSPASPLSTSTAWITDYNRIVNLAQSAYYERDYEKARSEYNRALSLANRNGDRQKAAFVYEQLAECDRAIEAARTSEAARRQKEMQERLAAYNFVGDFYLGSRYMIVQRKSNNSWGIINQEGNEVEAFNYSQVSVRLINGYYALKNDRGWVVFNASLNKVAANLENLDEYR